MIMNHEASVTMRIPKPHQMHHEHQVMLHREGVQKLVPSPNLHHRALLLGEEQGLHYCHSPTPSCNQTHICWVHSWKVCCRSALQLLSIAPIILFFLVMDIIAPMYLKLSSYCSHFKPTVVVFGGGKGQESVLKAMGECQQSKIMKHSDFLF